MKIRTEQELKNWFMENYNLLGYDKILRKDIGVCLHCYLKGTYNF